MTVPIRPTVLLLVTTFDIGGAERVYIHLAQGLSRKGYHVIAPCLQARSGAVARELTGSGVETVDLAAAGDFERIPRRKLRTIYNSVDVSSFDCCPRSTKNSAPPVTGSVARLNPEKDHATLLEALLLICHHHPGALLLLAGGGPDRSQFEKGVAGLALADNVRFLGLVEELRSASLAAAK